MQEDVVKVLDVQFRFDVGSVWQVDVKGGFYEMESCLVEYIVEFFFEFGWGGFDVVVLVVDLDCLD